MKILNEYFRKEFFRYIVITFLLVAVDFGQVFIPRYTRSAIDSISQKNISGLTKYSIYIIIISFGIVLLRFLYQALLRYAVLRFDNQLKNRIFENYVFFSKKDLEKFEIGDLMSRVTNDTTALRMFLIMGFLAIVDIFILGITTFVFMARMNLKLTVAVALPLILLFPIALNLGSKIHNIYRKINTIFADMSVRVRELVEGIRVIKAFVKENYFKSLFANVNEEYIKENIRLVKIDGFFDPLVNFLINFSIVILIFYGGSLYIQNRVDIGTIAAFFQYIQTLSWPMMAVGFSIALFRRATASLSRIEEVLSIKNEFSGLVKNDINRIKVSNLNFSYDGNVLVLKNINIEFEKGYIYGITGNPGSGKSTLLQALLKIIDVPSNTIFFDNTDIKAISFKTIKNLFAYVPQEIFLFSDTIENNIRVGKPDATFDEVVEASKVASLYDSIMSFKDKFKTVVGEQGITLSGGEKQRVAIARAILSKKPFLILDDAFSSVDFTTEFNIIKNLDEYAKKYGLTVILVSSRLSALMISKKIFVIFDGEVIEEGTFKELLDKQGYLYHIYKRQLLEETV